MVNRETDKCKNQQSNSALSVTTSAYYTECSTHTVRNIVDNPARFIIRLLFVSDLFLILYSIFVKQNQNKTNTETALMSKIQFRVHHNTELCFSAETLTDHLHRRANRPNSPTNVNDLPEYQSHWASGAGACGATRICQLFARIYHIIWVTWVTLA